MIECQTALAAAHPSEIGVRKNLRGEREGYDDAYKRPALLNFSRGASRIATAAVGRGGCLWQACRLLLFSRTRQTATLAAQPGLPNAPVRPILLQSWPSLVAAALGRNA